MSRAHEKLLERLHQLKEKRQDLESKLEERGNKRRRIDKSTLTPALQVLSDKAVSGEEHCFFYRTSAWTVFEIDLDIGRRGRSERRDANKIGKSALGLGVRLETFCNGQFFEPYYLVFAKPSQHVKGRVRVLPSLGHTDLQQTTDAAAANRSDTIRLLRHTVPHFVPLRDLVRRYLPANTTSTGLGGLELMQDLTSAHTFTHFLTHLHAHLQAYVSRRQQANALSLVTLPGTSHSFLQATGDESFGQSLITWALPRASEKDLAAFEYDQSLLYWQRDGSEERRHAAEIAAKEGEVKTRVFISIIYQDLSQDHVGAVVDQADDIETRLDILDDIRLTGLRCRNATVLVEVERSRVPDGRRTDHPRQAQSTKTRRPDWERKVAGTEQSLRESVEDIFQYSWREELQRVLAAKTGK